jgi:hypothetical protein
VKHKQQKLQNQYSHKFDKAQVAHKFDKGDLAITQVPLNSAYPRHYIPLGSQVTIADVHPANGHVAYLVIDDQDHSALVDETALESDGRPGQNA